MYVAVYAYAFVSVCAILHRGFPHSCQKVLIMKPRMHVHINRMVTLKFVILLY